MEQCCLGNFFYVYEDKDMNLENISLVMFWSVFVAFAKIL